MFFFYDFVLTHLICQKSFCDFPFYSWLLNFKSIAKFYCISYPSNLSLSFQKQKKFPWTVIKNFPNFKTTKKGNPSFTNARLRSKVHVPWLKIEALCLTKILPCPNHAISSFNFRACPPSIHYFFFIHPGNQILVGVCFMVKLLHFISFPHASALILWLIQGTFSDVTEFLPWFTNVIAAVTLSSL